MPVFIPKRGLEFHTKGPEFHTKSLPPNIMDAEKQVRDILAKASNKGDGSLTKDDLTKAFKEFGSKMPCWRAGLYLSGSDTNRDGQISSEEELDALVDFVLDKYYKLKM